MNTETSYATLSKIHPKRRAIKNLQEKIQSLEEKITHLRSDLQEAEKAARAKLRPEYEYQVFVGNTNELRFREFYRDLPEDVETVQIVERLLNKDAFDRHLHYFGACANYPKPKSTSVRYFRVGKVLCHVGVGHLILKDYIEVSDEEWESLKKGQIPERLISTHWR